MKSEEQKVDEQIATWKTGFGVLLVLVILYGVFTDETLRMIVFTGVAIVIGGSLVIMYIPYYLGKAFLKVVESLEGWSGYHDKKK